MPFFLVGDGHGGSEDYATCDLCFAAESQTDDGSALVMSCLGDVGRFAPTGPSINGVIIMTQGIQYNGANESSLAQGDRFDLNAGSATATAPVIIMDMYIDNRGQSFTRPLDVNVDFVNLQRLRIKNTATNTPTFGVTVQCPNSLATQLVISGGTDVVMWGFQDGMNMENLLIFGGGDKGVEAAGSLAYEVKDSFSTSNGGSDLDVGTLTITTCATEDTTGTFTGYTTAELVDFANDDFRTKSTSPLATLGTGGNFIGAFLESGGNDYSDTLDTGSFNLTGNDIGFITAYRDNLSEGTFNITGNDISFFAGYVDNLITGSFNLTGNPIAFIYSPNSNDYVDILESGAFILTGNNMNLIKDSKDDLSEGSYILNGNPILFGLSISLDSGSFTYSGFPIDFSAQYVDLIGIGNYTLTGFPITFIYSGQVIQKVNKVFTNYLDKGIVASYRGNPITAKYI